MTLALVKLKRGQFVSRGGSWITGEKISEAWINLDTVVDVVPSPKNPNSLQVITVGGGAITISGLHGTSDIPEVWDAIADARLRVLDERRKEAEAFGEIIKSSIREGVQELASVLKPDEIESTEPNKLDELVRELYSQHDSDRFQTVEELVVELESAGLLCRPGEVE